MHVRFAIDHHLVRGQAAGNFANVVNGRSAEAIHVATHFSFDERGTAGHSGAAQVALRSNVDFALGLDRAAEARRYFVIPQIDVRAALRAKT